MSKELTACKDCKNCNMQGSQRQKSEPIWYNLFCLAAPIPQRFDCYRGTTVDGSLPHCRDININGHCEWFETKGSS